MWETVDYRKRYIDVLGSATAQQLIRKNGEAWRSFFAASEAGKDTAPPGYWGNEEDGRELRTYIRNDQYTLEWGERSRLEIPVGKALKAEFGLNAHERLRLEVSGTPRWEGAQGRLAVFYDEVDDRFRAINLLGSTMLDRIHHWRKKPPLWISAPTSSSHAPRPPANSPCMRAAMYLSDSGQRPKRSPGYSHNSLRDDPVASELDGCIEREPVDAITSRMRWCAT